MKMKINDVTDSNKLVSHIILESITKECLETLPPKEDRSGDSEFEICVFFNGVEMDAARFFRVLEEQHTTIVKKEAIGEANRLFGEFKNTYKSKNSDNSKLEKIKNQIEKANQQLQNINLAISGL